MKAEWRSASTMHGALCVMTPGEVQMPLWCVDNWVSQLQVLVGVSILVYFIQLRYIYCVFVPTDAVAFGSAHFGAGTGSIYLDEVSCTGSESSLIDCSRSSSIRCYSGHSEDAGVRCQGML